MSLRPWNRPLPPQILLGGLKRFSDPLRDPDQKWEITGGRTSSPAPIIRSRTSDWPGKLNLQAEYSEGTPGEPSIDPQPPVLSYLDWDWVEYRRQLLPDLEEEVIIWVPDPRVICGSHRILNKGLSKVAINLKLTCLGSEAKGRIHFSSDVFQGRNILSGRSSSLNSLLFLTGGEPDPAQPSNQLISNLGLDPELKTELRWILICCDPGTYPGTYLEEAIKLDWDGEIGRRKVSLSGQLQIKTGDADQDFALACSQQQARLILNQYKLQVGPSDTAERSLELCQIWQLLLALEPLDSAALEWLMRKAFSDRQENRPEFPLGAELLWRAYQAGLDPDLIREFLPILIEDLRSWFSKNNDRDGDGIPEEPRGDYFGLENYSLPEKNSPRSESREDGQLEMPGLAGLLLNELHQLKKLLEAFPGFSIPSDLSDRIPPLEDYLIASWNDSERRFQTRDYQIHHSQGGYSLPGMVQESWNNFRIDLTNPSRLKLDIPTISSKETTENLRIILQGTDWQGRYRIEELTTKDIFWHDSDGWAITQSIYSRLDYCVVRGLGKREGIQINVPGSDRQDLSHALALWSESLPAGIAEKMVSSSLSRSGLYRSDFGLKSTSTKETSAVQLPLNLLVNQGLIKSGMDKMAGEVFRSWMEAAAGNILTEGRLFSGWDATTGAGLERMDLLESTLPVGMLLDLLGLRFLINGDLVLKARDPLLYPLGLTYRGIEITLKKKETIIGRPGGQKTALPREKEVLIQF